ncbi:MAG TPA: antibiotic biosynthesis monooxygenase [Lachnospiraceae bacterium]|nr:antibiotic biosynthesis monooxygenase [Lachnospiraceae bacterium]
MNNLNNQLDTVFCNVKYIESENVVLLTWKKFASYENFRLPTTFALELLRKYDSSSFVVDARNGFEDEKDDVEWGFSFLLPQMSQTTCKKVAFIMNKVTDIEGEMDMWTKEFGKYFAVYRVTTYEEALFKMGHMILVDVAYVMKEGKREEFYAKIAEQGIITSSRQEPGNYRYDFSIPMECDNELWITEIWTDSKAQQLHGKTEHYKKLTELKKDYVIQVKLNRYEIANTSL